MAFDLDDDELKTTREMHKLSDKNVAKIDDDINKLNKFCEYEDAVVLCEEALYEIQEAIERILSEREQDKKKIKELEEHQKKFYNGELYTAKQLKQIEENQNKYFINKQKVKDVLQKNRNELFSTTYVDDIQYKPYTMQIDRINKIERELLEGE